MSRRTPDNSSDTLKFAFVAVAIMIFMLLIGCGKFKLDTDVKVDGKVEVEHSFNLNDMKTYFKAKCQDLTVADDCYSVDLNECTDCMVGDFLTTIGQQ